jgi:hypothetical protein
MDGHTSVEKPGVESTFSSGGVSACSLNRPAHRHNHHVTVINPALLPPILVRFAVHYPKRDV